MKRRRKRLMVIIPVAAVCVAGAGTVGYFKVAHTKPAQKTAAKTQSAEAKKGTFPRRVCVPVIWTWQKMRLQSS